jgi:UDP-2-acetamido-3-amino-2,3-dideoxy-glucuronate N-acetyltransferase
MGLLLSESTLQSAGTRVEQAVGKLEQLSHASMAPNYRSFVPLALGFILIKVVHTARCQCANCALIIRKRGFGMSIDKNVQLGRGVRIYHPELVNLYGCVVGDETRIGAFVEIQVGAKIGALCKISSHTFICEGVTIEDEVFVGHGVMFINDRYPSATTDDGHLQGPADWKVIPIHVGRRASIGSNATIMCGVTIGEAAIIGAGAVVTRDVPRDTVVAGVPSRVVRDARHPSRK